MSKDQCIRYTVEHQSKNPWWVKPTFWQVMNLRIKKGLQDGHGICANETEVKVPLTKSQTLFTEEQIKIMCDRHCLKNPKPEICFEQPIPTPGPTPMASIPE